MVADLRADNLIWAVLTVIFIIITSTVLGYVARRIAAWRGLSPSEQRKIFWGFTLAGPWLIGFVIFVVGPALASLYYSFSDYKLGEAIEWNGLDNYRTLIMGLGAHGRRFSQALFNSFYYALIGVPLQIIAALLMALVLNNEVKGIRAFRTIFYLPVILAGGPAILLAWRYMLTSNGGFVNVILRKIADTFFVFDWLYRGFIYVMEGFNGFYAGLSRGDPIGPLKYTLPALLGLFVLLTLRGDWSSGKRARALLFAQLLGLIVLVATLPRGLVAEPIDPAWTCVAGLAVLSLIFLNDRQAKKRLVRLWQGLGLTLFGAGLILTLAANLTGEGGDPAPYLLAIAVAAIPLLLSLGRSRPNRLVLGLGAGVLVAILFVRLIPGQLDGGRLGLIPRYLTFNSALEMPQDGDYLEETYPEQTLSSLWIYGLAAALPAGIALLGERRPHARKVVLYAALAFFVLFAVSSALDGVRYFRAFNEIAQTSGRPVFHFALFRNSTAEFPAADRVPLWMTNELWTKPSLVLITMWSSGAGMLIFLAALKGVPGSLYEAAEVDGANRWQKFVKITLPMISPALFYNIVIGMIAALQTFDSIYILRAPETEDGLASAAYFLFNRTFRQLDIGQGAAASWILVAIIMLLTVLQFRFSNWVYYEAKA